MNDFSSSRRGAGDKRGAGEAGASKAAGTTVGKATLTEGLRGLDAEAEQPRARGLPRWSVTSGTTPGETGPDHAPDPGSVG